MNDDIPRKPLSTTATLSEIKEPPKKPRLTKFINSLTVLITLIILIQLIPIKVLNDWHITVNPTQAYHIGGDLTLRSEYRKVFNSSPSSQRFIECEFQGGVRDYPLYYSFAPHSTGKNISYATLTIPQIDQPLPAKCRVSVHVHYDLYHIKPVNQDNLSNEFTITK